jgi:hypothetical protein
MRGCLIPATVRKNGGFRGASSAVQQKTAYRMGISDAATIAGLAGPAHCGISMKHLGKLRDDQAAEKAA